MPSLVAADILRGTQRLLLDLGLTSLPEFTLATGRRVDLMALGPDGRFVAVEVKSSRADFLSDQKWTDYLAYADRFYFAVAPGFPLDILPPAEGLIVADRYAASLLRPACERTVPASRRRALLLRFARTAALRLQGAADPDALSEPA
ncbi:MmcB family DNA repair protein [Benzoatithermus flavus]|uniref:MmcB family DNA repair protein n=1 Tax=Benzoatithermus flavus TaxID=3108223 RepID=A0ABU8XMX0_9PROT